MRIIGTNLIFYFTIIKHGESICDGTLKNTSKTNPRCIFFTGPNIAVIDLNVLEV
jgi:hypothetical protein